MTKSKVLTTNKCFKRAQDSVAAGLMRFVTKGYIVHLSIRKITAINSALNSQKRNASLSGYHKTVHREKSTLQFTEHKQPVKRSSLLFFFSMSECWSVSLTYI